MNRYFGPVLVFLVLFTQAASAQSYLVTESAPVYPGDTTYVYVPITNQGFTFLEDVSVRLAPKDNASANAVTILNDVDQLGTMNNLGDQRTAKFRIHVNPEAVEGDYYFIVYITSTGKQTGSTPGMPLTTKLDDQILTVKGKPLIILVNSTLGMVAPMSVTTEMLQFKNTGTGTVQNTVVQIDLASSSTTSAFSVLGGGTQFSIGSLKSGDEARITFDLAVDIAARPGVYSIPLKITGLNNYSSTDYVGLVVGGPTDFQVSYQESLGSFSLNVANVGVNSASAVTVILPRQKNFTSSGSSSSVLGNLNPGDYTSALFQISKIPGAGNDLNIEIQYTDTTGKRNTITKDLPVILAATGVQGGSGRGSGTANYTTLVLAIAVIVVIYWQRKNITAYYHKLKVKK